MTSELGGISLREYLSARIEALDRHLVAEIAGLRSQTETATQVARDAVDKAEKAQERRLDLLNEFRAQAGDEAKKYALKEPLEERIGRIERFQASLMGGLFLLSLIGIANLVKVWTG